MQKYSPNCLYFIEYWILYALEKNSVSQIANHSEASSAQNTVSDAFAAASRVMLANDVEGPNNRKPLFEMNVHPQKSEDHTLDVYHNKEISVSWATYLVKKITITYIFLYLRDEFEYW